MIISVHQEDERIEGVFEKRAYIDVGNFIFLIILKY